MVVSAESTSWCDTLLVTHRNIIRKLYQVSTGKIIVDAVFQKCPKVKCQIYKGH